MLTGETMYKFEVGKC